MGKSLIVQKWIFIILVLSVFGCNYKQNGEPLPPQSSYNFFIISDIGQTQNFGNDSIAVILNKLAPVLKPRFIISSGDFFHNAGVKSTSDSLWDLTNSKIFASPFMKIDVYPVNGNHEYIGNPQATVDYSNINQHWKMEALNYTFVKKIDSIHAVRFIMVDTAPFVEKYQRDPKYHRVKLQNWKKTTQWLDSVLQTSKEEWKVVVGHHPIYTSDFGQGNTYELIRYVDPLLKKYKVDMYFSGHIHKFEHVRRDGMDYFSTANGGSVPRIATPWPNTVFVKKTLGFTVCTVSKDKFSVYFVDKSGKVVYTHQATKRI